MTPSETLNIVLMPPARPPACQSHSLQTIHHSLTTTFPFTLAAILQSQITADTRLHPPPPSPLSRLPFSSALAVALLKSNHLHLALHFLLKISYKDVHICLLRRAQTGFNYIREGGGGRSESVSPHLTWLHQWYPQ